MGPTVLEVVLLAFAVPTVLFGVLILLSRFEAYVVQPGEHAAQVVDLLDGSAEPDEIERATARLLAPAAPPERDEARGR